jgi:hypothetical protein
MKTNNNKMTLNTLRHYLFSQTKYRLNHHHRSKKNHLLSSFIIIIDYRTKSVKTNFFLFSSITHPSGIILTNEHHLTTNHLRLYSLSSEREKKRERRKFGMFNTNKKLDTHIMFVTISQLVIDYVISALRHFSEHI